MPNITGLGIVKNGVKGLPLNLSNARKKTWSQIQQMSTAEKKGVIICEDIPLGQGMRIDSDEVAYGNGSVKDALDDAKGNLLIEQLLTTTQTEYSLSEAYTNYKYLLLEVYDGTYIRGSACADSTLFNNVGGVVVPYFGGGNTYNASVKKVSSTSLKISCESGLIVTIRIYGIIAP